MTELQLKLLDMMDFFHKMCVKNHLKYYVIGGTALGAARHKGFIPWDDDIDVGMPRPDYEKLKKIASEKNTDKYCYEFPGENEDFAYPFGKLYNTETTLVEHNRYNTKRGIFIDIFPLDGSGNTMKESKKNFKKIDRINNWLISKTCAVRKGRKLYKNLAILCMKCIPDAVLNPQKLLQNISRESGRLNYDDCVYVANFVGNWHKKEISEKNWFGSPIECEFDGITVYRPEKIEKYLTAVYGDWKTPPPLEKQVTHHDYLYIDLNKSYKNKENC